MSTNRTTYHGNWGITFLEDGNVKGKIYFPLGPQGPVEFEYNKIRTIRNSWLFNGELPDGVVSPETTVNTGDR